MFYQSWYSSQIIIGSTQIIILCFENLSKEKPLKNSLFLGIQGIFQGISEWFA